VWWLAEGRRIFANTIKYVLMGTSSNFGNMFSTAGASAVLTFLPMLLRLKRGQARRSVQPTPTPKPALNQGLWTMLPVANGTRGRIVPDNVVAPARIG
jgi:hypothetical protein